MAILAADLHCIGDLAVDQAVAVAILREMAVGALHALLGVDVHQMDGLAGLLADIGEQFLGLGIELGIGRIDDDALLVDELALRVSPVEAELFRIFRIDDLARCIEQVAHAIALEDRAEIPAVAVIVGELRVLRLRVHIVIDAADEIDVAPLAARRRRLGVAFEHLMHFGGGRIFLLGRPHQRRVGLIVPHGVAEIAVQEDVRLVHVAVHALGRRDGAG